jgi:hypothetical protein
LLVVATSCEYNSIRGEDDCLKSDLTLALKFKSDLSGCGVSDGLVEVEATGGAGPYLFRLGLLTQPQSLFSGLSAGRYTIVVFDKNSCTDTLFVDLVNFESDLSAQVEILQPDSECFSGNGSVTLSGIGGAPPYLYSRNGVEFNETNTFTSLEHGIYLGYVLDQNNCQFTRSFEVPRVPTGISWQDHIKPIIETRCAKAGCHIENTGRVPLVTYNDVFFNRSAVKGRVVSLSMPFDGSLPADQIQMIACWVDDGAPEN